MSEANKGVVVAGFYDRSLLVHDGAVGSEVVVNIVTPVEIAR